MPRGKFDSTNEKHFPDLGGSERPVAFASRLNAQIDKEALSIVWGSETVPSVPLWEAVYARYRPQAPHCHFPPREGSSCHNRCETLYAGFDLATSANPTEYSTQCGWYSSRDTRGRYTGDGSCSPTYSSRPS